MNKVFRARILRCAAALAAVITILFLYGCGSQEAAAKPEEYATEQQKSELSQELSALNAQLCELFSVSGSDAVSGSDTLWSAATYGELRQAADAAKLSLLKGASLRLLGEEHDFCLGQSGGESSALDAKAAEISSGIASTSDAEQLYYITADIMNQLFGASAVECTAENRDKLRVSPSFTTDESGSTWLAFTTNFPLPGFEDSALGYSLRLELDGGKTELTVADSIFAHDNIRYDSGYCVCFNMTALLKNCSVESFFTGRNRVTFTVFALDNSFSSSQEFYRLRQTADASFSISEKQSALADVIRNAA